MTIIELLVVIGIIGLLLALTLPAVQSIRARSYRLQCSHQLRQVMLAMHQYVEVYGAIPCTVEQAPNTGVFIGLLARLLPPLKIASFDDIVKQPGLRVNLLKCPADGLVHQYPESSSYILNNSPGMLAGPRLTPLFEYVAHMDRKLADISDGLSQTAAISENATRRLIPTESTYSFASSSLGYWLVPYHPVSDATYYHPETPAAIAERTAQTEESIEHCYDGPRMFVSVNREINRDNILTWRQPGRDDSYYTHWLRPNAPPCTSDSTYNEDVFLNTNRPASSLHHGGVNVAMLDGRVVFVSDSIDTRVWRAIGTMAGQETESLENE